MPITDDGTDGVIRFAALGDSLTLGIGDPMPDGRWRGWAALLAASLRPPDGVRLYNVAASGARITDVAGSQLAGALQVRPHLASVVAGVNDTPRTGFDVAAVADALTATVAALTGYGAVVLTARLPEPGHLLRLPASLARPLARRIDAVNTVVDAVAARYRTVHVDLTRLPDTYDRRMWSVDRLHPSERGHRLLARRFADALADRGFQVATPPGLRPDNPEPTRRAQARWMATEGTRWIAHRCTDLLPELARMAAAEWWHARRGTASRLDDRLSGELADALSRLAHPVGLAGTGPLA